MVRLHDNEAVLEHGAVGDSKGIGSAEHAIRKVSAKIRTTQKQVEELRKVELDVEHLIYPWGEEFVSASTKIGAGSQVAKQRGSCFMADRASASMWSSLRR